MYTKANIGSHPIHPMLVAFPAVFYTLTVVAFAVYQFVSPNLFWYQLAFFSNFAGVGTAVLAAIPGLIDWTFGIPNESAAKSRGLLHMGLNVAALLLFAWSALQIYGTWEAPLADVAVPLTISVFGLLLTMAAAYHGWSLVSTHKVGVAMTPEQERLEPTGEMSRRAHEMPQRPRTV